MELTEKHAELVGLHFGDGSHTLVIQTLDSSSAVLNSKDALVLAVEPLDSGIQSDLQSRIDSLKSEIDSLEQQLDSANQQNSALQQSLSKQDSRLEEQSNALSNLAALVELVRKNQSNSTSFSQTADQQLQELQQRVSDLQKPVESGSDSSVTSFVTAGAFSWSVATIFGLLILVGIAGFTVYRHVQEKKIY